MAFNQSNAASQNANQGNDAWKAQAFLNLYVQRADGSKAKVGAIPLKESRRFDKALIERLKQDGAVDAFKEALVIDFQLTDAGTPVDAGF